MRYEQLNFFEKFLAVLQVTNFDRPGNYGWFHLLFFGLTILASVLLCVFFRNAKEKTAKRILLIGWLIMVIFEIYKQLIFVGFHFNTSDNTYSWDYSWYAFPYQLCSTPLYALPFVIFCKPGKIRDAFSSFIVFFAMFGGVCVMFYPNDVFATDLLGIQIQTMVHHGLQVVLGVYLIAYNRKKINIFYFLKGAIVFVGAVIIAMLINILLYPVVNETFNMFYISPYYPCTLPLLSMIYPKVHYVVFFLIYCIGFILASLVIFGITKLIFFLIKFHKQNKLDKNNV